MKASAVWLLSVLALGACQRAAPPEAKGPPPGHVTVNVACPTNSVTATVTHWRTTVGGSAPDSVIWDPVGQADSLWITPSQATPPWPFQTQKFVSHGPRPALSGKASQQKPGTVVRYTITAFCGGITVVIDPELIFP